MNRHLSARLERAAPVAPSRPPDEPCVELCAAGLGTLMPMHLLLDREGAVLSAGPTLRKLPLPGRLDLGAPFDATFELRRPLDLSTVEDMREAAGARLHLRARGNCALRFTGVAVPAGEGVLLDLSFGLGVVDAVSRHGLSSEDFAPTDLTVGLLYLVEANAAAMAEARDLNHRLEDARMAAEEEAYTDELTGLRNRRALDALLKRVAGSGRPFALMNLDLDYFKAVNDTHGHAAGDHMLRRAAGQMRSAVREGDIVARIGGDEFAIVMMGGLSRERLLDVSERLIGQIETPETVGRARLAISASIGIAVHDGIDQADLEGLAADADSALYRSKDAGRGRATIACSVGSGSP